MNSLSKLPKAVQQELQSNLEKQDEERGVRVSKVRQARMIVSLMGKYNFRRKDAHRFGMN